MLRKDGNYTIFQIEEYQSAYDRWVLLQERHFLKQYEFGQQTACGECWQCTGEFGAFDEGYMRQLCNDLNQAVEDGYFKDDTAEVNKFRLVKYEVSQKRTPIEFDRY